MPKKILSVGAIALALASGGVASASSAPHAGAFCKKADIGKTATATNGKKVKCESHGGKAPHWYTQK